MPFPLLEFLNSGLYSQIQIRGVPINGPITPALTILQSFSNNGSPYSPIGQNLVNLISHKDIRVFYLPLRGTAFVPWRNTVVLDLSLVGNKQVVSAQSVSLIAHELIHILQRNKGTDHFPAGGLRLRGASRLIGDSTSYMEVLAYIVGATVEYDLLSSHPLYISSRTITRIQRIKNDLMALTGDSQSAVDFVSEKYGHMKVYRRNIRHEAQQQDKRIPEGDWRFWLKEIGFTNSSISQIQSIVNISDLEQL